MIESESLNERGVSGSRQDRTNPKGGASGSVAFEASRRRWEDFTSFTISSGLWISVIDQGGATPGVKVCPILESCPGTLFCLSTAAGSLPNPSRPGSFGTL